jgi:hypothetical protein
MTISTTFISALTGTKSLKVAVRVTGDSIKIIDLHFDKPDAPPLQGDPEELLELWQKKLALKLNEETGKIEPLFQ